MRRNLSPSLPALLALLAMAVLGAAVTLAPSAAAASRQVASRLISASQGGRLHLGHGVTLTIPAHALRHTARVWVIRSSPDEYRLRVDARWTGALYISSPFSHGRHRVGGILLHAPSASRAARVAALLPESSEFCFELADAGAGVLDGIPVAACFLAVIAGHHLNTQAEAQVKAELVQIAGNISPVCAQAVQDSPDPLPISVFRSPECNPPRGPSDGTPLVVATLTPPPVSGIPLTPTTPPSTPLPGPPTPAPSPSGPIFTVMNTSETPPDGVWFRWAPYIADTDRVTGHGVYMNERVQLMCYGWGEAVGPYANRAWYQVLNVSRPTNAGVSNSGWLNAHYINDGLLTNQVDAGVPAC
jgi:hypothetical protein